MRFVALAAAIVAINIGVAHAQQAKPYDWSDAAKQMVIDDEAQRKADWRAGMQQMIDEQQQRSEATRREILDDTARRGEYDSLQQGLSSLRSREIDQSSKPEPDKVLEQQNRDLDAERARAARIEQQELDDDFDDAVAKAERENERR